MTKYELYEHHGRGVFVRSDLRGKHKDYCLCYSCDLFRPNSENNCPIAAAVFELDKRLHITTPVWECPVFVESEAGK